MRSAHERDASTLFRRRCYGVLDTEECLRLTAPTGALSTLRLLCPIYACCGAVSSIGASAAARTKASTYDMPRKSNGGHFSIETGRQSRRCPSRKLLRRRARGRLPTARGEIPRSGAQSINGKRTGKSAVHRKKMGSLSRLFSQHPRNSTNRLAHWR
jgi:hypothetical protein